MKVVIKTNKSYGSYLAKHLATEHPKTKGHIKLRRGQVTFIAILFTFFGLLAVFALNAALINGINDVLPYADDTSATVMRFIPALLLLGVLFGFFFYVSPQRRVV